MSDAVTAHVAELGRALHGSSRLRRSMLAEVRHGLLDAAAAHEDGGLPAPVAAAHAVRDFGSVAEIAPLLQDELTARQSRCTALLLAVLFPGLVLGWNLLWKGGIGWSGPSVPLVTALARVQDVASWGVGVAALVALLLTFGRRHPPRRLATAIGGIGVTGVVVCGGAAMVMMTVGSGPANSLVVVTDPVAPVAYGVSLAVLVLTTWSVARTVRILLRGPAPRVIGADAT